MDFWCFLFIIELSCLVLGRKNKITPCFIAFCKSAFYSRTCIEFKSLLVIALSKAGSLASCSSLIGGGANSNLLSSTSEIDLDLYPENYQLNIYITNNDLRHRLWSHSHFTKSISLVWFLFRLFDWFIFTNYLFISSTVCILS